VQVNKFYDILQFELQKSGYSPAQIYNIDETGISGVQNPCRIIAHKGTKQVGKIVSAERGTTTTVVCAVNAAGHYIPPVFLFKRKNMNDAKQSHQLRWATISQWVDGLSAICEVHGTLYQVC